MNIRHLEHFLAVAETGSFSRSADKLFITQSALSRSIQALESEVGGLLFDRVGKRIELTPLGQGVAARAKRIVLEASELKRGAELMRQADAGTLRVGLGAGPGAILMSPLLCHMARHHPKVHVRAVRGPTDLQVVQLRSRQLDALVVDLRVLPADEDLIIEAISEMPGGWMVRTGHPLLSRRSVTLADVQKYPVASVPLSAEVTRAVVELYGQQAHPARLVTLECTDIETLINVIERTDTVLLGVLASARERIVAGAVAQLPVNPVLKATARFGLVTLAGRSQAPVISILRAVMAEQMVG